jgi:hypothetical protein
MPSLKQVEQQILTREGFRVSLVPLDPKTKSFPAYEYPVMASNKWRVSDWKTVRMGPYIALLRGVTVYRGGGQAVKTDMRLGNLRDTYFDAEYGEAKAEGLPANVFSIASAPSRRKRE